MGSPGDAYDTAAESFMATVKTELRRRQSFKSRNEARLAVLLAVFRYIEIVYNPTRCHSAPG
jgi:hypothetical protein